MAFCLNTSTARAMSPISSLVVARRDPDVMVAGREPAHHAGHVMQRTDDAAADHEGQRAADHQRRAPRGFAAAATPRRDSRLGRRARLVSNPWSASCRAVSSAACIATICGRIWSAYRCRDRQSRR